VTSSLESHRKGYCDVKSSSTKSADSTGRSISASASQVAESAQKAMANTRSASCSGAVCGSTARRPITISCEVKP
jgi:hypothetical protein